MKFLIISGKIGKKKITLHNTYFNYMHFHRTALDGVILGGTLCALTNNIQLFQSFALNLPLLEDKVNYPANTPL
jgi:hypothetical protein